MFCLLVLIISELGESYQAWDPKPYQASWSIWKPKPRRTVFLFPSELINLLRKTVCKGKKTTLRSHMSTHEFDHKFKFRASTLLVKSTHWWKKTFKGTLSVYNPQGQAVVVTLQGWSSRAPVLTWGLGPLTSFQRILSNWYSASTSQKVNTAALQLLWLRGLHLSFLWGKVNKHLMSSKIYYSLIVNNFTKSRMIWASFLINIYSVKYSL